MSNVNDSNKHMTPDEAQELKVAISNEIARRTVASTDNPPGGTPGDPNGVTRTRSNNGSNVLTLPVMDKPITGKPITAEEGTQLLGNLAKINKGGKIQQGAGMQRGDPIPPEFDYNFLKNYLQGLSVPADVSVESSGCASSCTGLCAGNCYASCTGYFTFNVNFFSDFFSSFSGNFTGSSSDQGQSGMSDQAGSPGFSVNATVEGFHNTFSGSSTGEFYGNSAFTSSSFTTSFGGNGSTFNVSSFTSGFDSYASDGSAGFTSNVVDGPDSNFTANFATNGFDNSVDNSGFSGNFSGNFTGNFSGNFTGNFTNISSFSVNGFSGSSPQSFHNVYFSSNIPKFSSNGY